MLQAATTILFLREMALLHPFWSRYFWRAFGALGVAIGILLFCASTTLILWKTDFEPVLQFALVILGGLFVPMFAIPLASSVRLFILLFTPQRGEVGDWVITQVIGIGLLVLGHFLGDPYSPYIYLAGAAALLIFPRIAFERVYGPLCPKTDA